MDNIKTVFNHLISCKILDYLDVKDFFNLCLVNFEIYTEVICRNNKQFVIEFKNNYIQCQYVMIAESTITKQCENYMHLNTSTKICASCNKIQQCICDKHDTYCFNCKSLLCRECMKDEISDLMIHQCATCEKVACPNCPFLLKLCSVCQEVVCNDCKKTVPDSRCAYNDCEKFWGNGKACEKCYNILKKRKEELVSCPICHSKVCEEHIHKCKVCLKICCAKCCCETSVHLDYYCQTCYMITFYKNPKHLDNCPFCNCSIFGSDPQYCKQCKLYGCGDCILDNNLCNYCDTQLLLMDEQPKKKQKIK